MDLSRLAIETRPRNPWEAADLGLLMARRWWWPLLSIWLFVAVPVWLLFLLLPTDWLWWQALIFWWLKPLYERPMLHYLSRAVFGEKVSVKDCVGQFFKLAWVQLFLSLTWRRLSPSRSMDVAVIQLEGLSGARRSQRLAVLHRMGSGPATWLTIVGIHLEAFIAFALIGAIWAFIPAEVDIDIQADVLFEYEWQVHLLINFISLIGTALIAPFYVASGFAIYLNRRIHLEAWDLEIEFRKMVQKREQAPRSPPLKPSHLASVIVLFALCVATFSPPGELHAQSQANDAASVSGLYDLDHESSKSLIEEIKAGDEFHNVETYDEPDFSAFFNSDDNNDKKKSDFDWNGFGAIVKFFALLAAYGEYLLWFAVLIIVVILILRYREWLSKYFVDTPTEDARKIPDTMFGMDVRKESLPDDLGLSALALWEKGERRAAISLLYRGCLAEIIHLGIVLEESYTEQECVAAVSAAGARMNDGMMDYFCAVTQLWRKMAYGHMEPNAVAANKYFQNWNTIWSGPVDTSGVKSD